MPVVTVHSLNSRRRLPMWCGRFYISTEKEGPMQVYYFTELPYHEYPEEEGAKYPSLRLTFPNTYYDPHKAHALFHRYLDEYQYCEEMGFDGLMLNEHHSTPSCMNATMNLIGAILARNTRHAKLL